MCRKEASVFHSYCCDNVWSFEIIFNTRMLKLSFVLGFNVPLTLLESFCDGKLSTTKASTRGINSVAYLITTHEQTKSK